MLVTGIDAKILEDQQEYKNVVNAQGFFDDVAGEELKPGTTAVRNENPCAKPERERDPCHALQNCLAQRNHVRAPVKQRQIEQEQHRYSCVKGNP